MRTTLTAALVGEPLTLKSDGPSQAGCAFHEGEEVVLVGGPNQGTLGAFLALRTDIRWADITERNGAVRSHPVEWLARSTAETPGFSEAFGARR
jgi:hypothetical protein